MATETIQKCDFSGKQVDIVKPVELVIGGDTIRLPNPADVNGLDEIGPDREAALIAFYQNGCRPVRKKKSAPKKKKGEAGE